MGKAPGRSSQAPRPASIAEIASRAQGALAHPEVRSHFAGTPVMQPAPGGLQAIQSHRTGPSMGVSGGWTGCHRATAFTIPELRTTRTSERNGPQVQHYAEVQPTTTADVTHESYYVGPGDHEVPGRTETIDGQPHQAYYRISAELSSLLGRGEQEHLDDCQRAYEITYALIAARINALVGQRFGPASSPAAADALANAALERSLPPQLGTRPGNWARMLDALLDMTALRDYRVWHTVEPAMHPVEVSEGRAVFEVTPAPSVNIGQVPPEQLINYPETAPGEEAAPSEEAAPGEETAPGGEAPPQQEPSAP